MHLKKKISKMNPDLVFKGGTSLSKCYGLIDRFSEDIDIAFSGKATGTVKGEVRDAVIRSINELGFTLANPDAIKHRQKLNHYRIKYEPVSAGSNPSVKGGEVEVETSFFFEFLSRFLLPQCKHHGALIFPPVFPSDGI